MRNLAVLIAAVLAACSSTEPGNGALRLSAQLDRSIVQHGDSVRISLTLTNVSPQPVQVMPAEAYGMCMRAFEVYDARNRPVSVMEALCALVDIVVPAPVVLQPGANIVIMDWWKPAESSIDGVPLISGMYSLRGRAFGGDNTTFSERRTVLLQ